MAFAIELRFDRTAEGRIREIWAAAAAFYGTSYLLDHGVIPHVALLVGDSRLHEVFATLDPPAAGLALTGMGFFGAGEVAYLRAELSPELLAFHGNAYRRAVQLGVPVDAHYRPDQWVPHCTIAQACRTHRAEPLTVGAIDATVESLILVRYPPTTVLAERPARPPAHHAAEPPRDSSGAVGSR